MICMCFLSFGIFKGQQPEKYIEIKWENGSRKAKEIMVSSFYYDPLDAWSPFGNDI